MAPRKVEGCEGFPRRPRKQDHLISTRARQRWFCICWYLAKPGLDIQ